jgi:hypothetical protein
VTVVIDTSLAEEATRTRRETRARRKRLLRRGRGCALWTVSVAVILGVGTWFVVTAWAWADRRTGEEALAEARAAGVPLTMRDLAARQPVSPEIAEATEFWRLAMAEVDVERFRDRSFARVPVLGELRSDGGADPPDRDAQGHLQGEDLVAAEQFLAPLEQTFAAARSARDAGGVANFGAPLADQTVDAAVDPYRLLFLGMALRLKVETRLGDDDADGAIDDLTTLVAVSDALRYEPHDWHQDCRHLALGWAVDLLERMLAVKRLNDDQLRRLAEAFRERDEARSFRLAVAGARFYFVTCVQVADEEFAQQFFRVDYSSWTRGADLAEGLDLFAQMDEASENGLLAANERRSSIEAELSALDARFSAGTRYPATLMLVPQLGQQLDSHLKAEASFTLARTAIACERYRLVHGKLPAKLDDLTPEFLAEPPLDPCNGKPLRYVDDARGVQLYSVGADGVDGGGAAAARSGAALFAPPDIAFRLKKTKPKAEAGAAP